MPCRGLVLVDVAPRLETKGVRRVIEFMRRHPDGFDSLDQVQDAVAAYNPTRKAQSSSQGLRKTSARTLMAVSIGTGILRFLIMR